MTTLSLIEMVKGCSIALVVCTLIGGVVGWHEKPSITFAFRSALSSFAFAFTVLLVAVSLFFIGSI